jgi:hypothetical protein
VIGGKILSGRTKDHNVGYIAEYLTAVGIDLKEVRVVGDEERAIVDALNVRARHPARMGEDDGRRDERCTPAHDAHPQGRIADGDQQTIN